MFVWWGLRLAGTIQLSLNAVVEGAPRLVDRHLPLELARGDVALSLVLDHHIADLARRRAPGAGRVPQAARARQIRRTAATVFLCGAYRFGYVGQGLLDALPPILPLFAAVGDPLHDVIELVSRELAHRRPASANRP